MLLASSEICEAVLAEKQDHDIHLSSLTTSRLCFSLGSAQKTRISDYVRLISSLSSDLISKLQQYVPWEPQTE